MHDLVLETTDKTASKINNIHRVVHDKRCQINAHQNLARMVALMGFVEGRICRPATGHGEIVAFSTGNLGCEDRIEFFG